MKELFHTIIQNGITPSLSEEQTRNIRLANMLNLIFTFLDFPFLIIFRNEIWAVALTSIPLFVHLFIFLFIKYKHHRTGRFLLSINTAVSVFFVAGMVYVDDGTEGMAAKFLIFGTIVLPFLLFKAKEWKFILSAVFIDFFCISFFDYYNTEIAIKSAFDTNFDTPILRLFAILTAFIMLVTAFLYYKIELYKYNKERNNIIKEIKKQKQIIELQQQKTHYDIKYAQTIQEAILPIHGEMSDFYEHFVIYKAKDLVSGDFFWFKRLNEKQALLAVGDCTGHGVSGAFMSLIASRILDEIVIQKKVVQVDEILNQLKTAIRITLKQDINTNTDGLDICLCKLSEQANEAVNCEFSGAKRPLFIFNSTENTIISLKGDRIQIGGKKRNNKKFSTQEVTLQKNDVIYLTSDGYTDQAPEGKKKIGTLKLKELLKQVGNKSIIEQKQFLEQFLENHLEGDNQRDDITLMGIKISDANSKMLHLT